MKRTIIGILMLHGLVATARRDEFALSTNIHRLIFSRTTALAEQDMRLYTNTIPTTNVVYRMTPIRGGEFLMRSPLSEVGHNAGRASESAGLRPEYPQARRLTQTNHHAPQRTAESEAQHVWRVANCPTGLSTH